MSTDQGTQKEPMLLTTSEAADLLCVHPNTLRRWADSNLLRSYRIGPRKDRRFLREDIERHLAGACRGSCTTEA